jgi:hypothetical protein
LYRFYARTVSAEPRPKRSILGRSANIE